MFDSYATGPEPAPVTIRTRADAPMDVKPLGTVVPLSTIGIPVGDCRVSRGLAGACGVGGPGSRPCRGWGRLAHRERVRR
jgi:hypothetical protein